MSLNQERVDAALARVKNLNRHHWFRDSPLNWPKWWDIPYDYKLRKRDYPPAPVCLKCGLASYEQPMWGCDVSG